jgi:flagellar hook-associated protein 1 FlgK
MSNLFSSISSSGNALAVFENALTVSQNNVANAATPGYAAQSLSLESQPFDIRSGLTGGVTGTQVDSARDVFAEQTVQRESTALGQWNQQVSTLSPLQDNFDLSGQTGIPAALSQFTTAASAWSSAPNDASARQDVLTAAQTVARAFNQTSTALSNAVTTADGQLQSLANQVNTLAAQIAKDNQHRSGSGTPDPSVDANLYSSLEQLSQIAPITTLKQNDGSMTVLIGGQTPLVMGDTAYSIGTSAAGAPSAQVLDSNGNDITSQIGSGSMGGLLQARNGVMSTVGTSLNQLAQSVADRVNGLLTSGNVSDGPPAVPGVPIFTYTPGAPAATMAVDPNVTPAQLAAIAPGPPETGNGIAQSLANLATPQGPADEVNGMSYAQFFGNIAAQVGAAISTATNNQSVQQSVVTQAQNLRTQTSGVSLDQEAIQVLEFQRSYDAASKMVTVLDQMTQAVVAMIQ